MCTQDGQKLCTKLLPLCDNASKTQILVPQVNKKFGPSERLHLSPGRIVNIQREELQPWICHGNIFQFQSIGQNPHESALRPLQ